MHTTNTPRRANKESQIPAGPGTVLAAPLFVQQPAWWNMIPYYCSYWPSGGCKCEQPICGALRKMKPPPCKVLVQLNFLAYGAEHIVTVSKRHLAAELEMGKRLVDRSVDELIARLLIAVVIQEGEKTGRGHQRVYRIMDAPKGCQLRQKGCQNGPERVSKRTVKGVKTDTNNYLLTSFKTNSNETPNDIPELNDCPAFFNERMTGYMDSIRNPETGRPEIPGPEELSSVRREIARVTLGNPNLWKKIPKSLAETPELFE